MLRFATLATAALTSEDVAMTVVLILVAVIAWLLGRALVRRMQASAVEPVVRGRFDAFALEALANAAKLDGRVTVPERDAVKSALLDACGLEVSSGEVDRALQNASLAKDALVAYLEQHSSLFSDDQKVQFLRALLSVLVADGRFDETEHQALVEYTNAIGFDRQSAPQRLRSLVSEMARDRIT